MGIRQHADIDPRGAQTKQRMDCLKSREWQRDTEEREMCLTACKNDQWRRGLNTIYILVIALHGVAITHFD